MPKKEIGADRFLEAHREYDGRGVVVAIFDSGVDPAASGLQVTSDGKPKILDILDCTGSGDIDTSKVVKANADGCITGSSGTTLGLNPSWSNPSGEWHVGCKLIYELFPASLMNRVKKERKRKWDEKNHEAISDALMSLNEFDKEHDKTEDKNLGRFRDDLQNRFDFLKKEAESYDDRGPVIDVVVWNDGIVWRVAIDTQNLEDVKDHGKLADFVPMTNYRIERKFGIFSKLDSCSFVTNVYNDGNILSLVTDCSPHGTHVAGITAAFHPEEPLLNGVAPGAQLISCKIGDSRLGSMETGTGLIRALIAAVEHKCDLINMSYGEPSILPDYGRFVDLLNEVVDRKNLIFISSAGNKGPALSTVGSPGGTSSSIIGVGAYVSPAMAAGAHCLVEPPTEGLEYTWSSRGPTVDGDIGVSISAPGCAVAPVPTWTLQRRKLMNGTSMASPCACGGVALLISGMKVEDIPISPYIVRKALENTAVSVGVTPEDKLSTGQGLMQIDRAYDYILQSKTLPLVCYETRMNRTGKTNSLLRGIYLREPSACLQTSEWTVQVQPKFHEDASNLEQRVPFEECIQLHSSDKAVVRTADFLFLTNNGRSFNIVIDPTNLDDGLHYYEVYGIDCKAPWRGPLFRVPITIIKPYIPNGQPPLALFSGVSFRPGHIFRNFIEVPLGASWAEAKMRASNFDTSRMFFINTVQISPLERNIEWDRVVSFSSPSFKSFNFPVRGGLTMELVISQFWSSGIGSQEVALVDFEVVFHGIEVNVKDVVLDGSESPVRIDSKTLLCCEELIPSATLNMVRIPYRPLESKLSALLTDRDKLPCGKHINGLKLIYQFKLDEGAEIRPYIPLLNNRIYDTKFESQFYMIADSYKRIYATGDAYPEFTKLSKGEYKLQLYIRHENAILLEKMKQNILFIERKLENKDSIQLNFFSQPDGSIMDNGSLKNSVLVAGELQAFYVGPPSKEKIPKNCPSGSLLLGKISYGKIGPNKQFPPISYPISLVVPPPKLDMNKEKEVSICNKNISEHLEEEVRDAKIRLLSSYKCRSEDDRLAWMKFAASLKEEYPTYTLLFSKILESLLSKDTDEKNKLNHHHEIINAAKDVIESIDKDKLANYFSLRSDIDDESEKIKEKMETMRDQLAEALYQKGLALSEIEKAKVNLVTDILGSRSDSDLPVVAEKSESFEENLNELKKWVDVKLPKYAMLLFIHERCNKRLGTALKILDDIILDDSNSSKKKLYDLKISLLNEMGWSHAAAYELQWLQIRFPPCLPPF